MVAVVHAAGLSGIDGYIVTVEGMLSGGLPRMDIVGCPTRRFRNQRNGCAARSSSWAMTGRSPG